MNDVAHPDALVSTDWVAARLDVERCRVIEVDLNAANYAGGHLRGAVSWTLWGDLLDGNDRLKDDPAFISDLLSRSGISPDSTVVLYGDMWNWGATLAFWLLTAVGHRDIRLMDGGRDVWIREGRPLTTDSPEVRATHYPIERLDWSQRARRGDVLAAIESGQVTILDVRLQEEFAGELFRPGKPPEEGQRAGHIPGAVHVPWETAIHEDGTFKSTTEIRKAYALAGITGDREIIPYCTVGGRSGHSWFVLSQLLGVENVRLYEASWSEWGQIEGLPVARPGGVVIG